MSWPDDALFRSAVCCPTDYKWSADNQCYWDSNAYDSPTTCNEEMPSWQISLYWSVCVVLIILSGLFSGLTLGLLGLDKIGLEIVAGGGDPKLATYAKKIIPIRENGNLLLCSLLFGNVAVNSLLSILMSTLTSGLVGFLGSTAGILIIGEIIPQATCSRYALVIGARLVFLVRFLLIIFYPICKPLALALDCMLGEEVGCIHSRVELMKMLAIYESRGALDNQAASMMTGAMRIRDMKVHHFLNDFACFGL